MSGARWILTVIAVVVGVLLVAAAVVFMVPEGYSKSDGGCIVQMDKPSMAFTYSESARVCPEATP